MVIRNRPWPNGVPCWADLAVPDVAAAKDFYSAVLGWDYQPPVEEFGGYVVAELRGSRTAGIGSTFSPDQPAAWRLYIATDDADSTATAVTANGGTLLMGPGDVGPFGRSFLAADPTGAAFGGWQAGSTVGSELVNEPGGLIWEDLRSTDPDTARSFYNALFGYTYESMDMASEDYRTFTHPDETAPLGGMGGFFDGEGASHWLVYFGVADTVAAVAAAEQAGGRVVMPVTETPFGAMAGLTDPWGAVFQLVQTEGQDHRA